MERSLWRRAILRAGAAVLMMVCAAEAAAAKPNIIVILSDDMGFSDIGCYGGEIRTPNLDALAADGIRFTQFYNTGRCCPTRASLLTGLYPHQAGVGHMMQDRGTEGYRGDLNRRCATLAVVLRPAGYGTYAVGKWHVTRFAQADDSAQLAAATRFRPVLRNHPWGRQFLRSVDADARQHAGFAVC